MKKPFDQTKPPPPEGSIEYYIHHFVIVLCNLSLLYDNQLPDEMSRLLAEIITRIGSPSIIQFLREATEVMDEACQAFRTLHPQLVKFMEYIEQHHGSESLNISQTAAFMGMSRGTLHRFLKQKGILFSSYVNKVRIAHATRLLETTQDSISEIGYFCGFNTINYFIKVFKSEKQVTPGEYRARFPKV